MTGILAQMARLLMIAGCFFLPATAQAEKILVAAAADLKFALEEIAIDFRAANPDDTLELVFGSSGKFHTQILQGAPYSLFFSADIEYPRELARRGFAAADVKPYAIGRLVLWSRALDAKKMTLASLAAPGIKHIAIANPRHAPYGRRAEEALRAAGVWGDIEQKLVRGENVGQAAQYVQTGNAEVGVIALSLALSPDLAKMGSYWLIPENLHQRLEQGYIITRRAEKNALARRFADYMASRQARAIMVRHGFVLPGEATGK